MNLVESQKRLCPKEIEDYNFDIYFFAASVVEFNIGLAKKNLDHISNSRLQFNIMAEIFKKEAQSEGYDKEKGFAELESFYKSIFESNFSITLGMFSAASEHMGVARAQPFLKALHESAESEFPYSNEMRQVLYGYILEAELEYDCPTLNDTVNTIHVLAREKGNYDSILIEPLVKAELSLL